MKSISKLVLGFTAAGLIAAGSAMATPTSNTNGASNNQPSASQQQGSAGPLIAKLSQNLKLTDAQKAQIKSLVQASDAEARALNRQMLMQRRNFFQAVHSDSFNEGKIQNLANQQGQTVSKMLIQSANLQHKISQVLTAAQRKELRAMMPKPAGANS